MESGHLLSDLSNQLASLVDETAASVVQVRGRHARPSTGTVFAPERVVIVAHALDHRNGLTVRPADRAPLAAELAGMDPATDLAVLRVPGCEQQVLDLLGLGLSNEHIGMRLGISEHTAKFHVASVLANLGAHNRAEAVRRWIRRGLVTV